MCRSPSPLDMSPSSSKAALLGSMHTTPGVTRPRTPAEWWVLRAWRVWIRDWIFLWRWGKGLWHAPMRVSPALWSSCRGGCSYLGKGLFYLLLFLSFSLSSSSSLLSRFTSTQVLCGSLRRSSPCPCSFTPLVSNFPLTPRSLFTATPTLFRYLCCSPLFFSFFPISSILPFQHMTDCVINEHHKPLFLLATH